MGELMMQLNVHEMVWPYISNPNYQIMYYAMAVVRGLSVDEKAQEIFPRMGILPILISIFGNNQATKDLLVLVLEIFMHLSFNRANAPMILEDTSIDCIERAATSFD